MGNPKEKKNKHKCKNNLNIFYHFIYKFFKKCGILTFLKSPYYGTVHSIYGLCIAIIIIVNNNICNLLAVLCIISLNALSIVILHECPLSMLEKKYSKTSLSDNKRVTYKNLGILYNCDHSYEQELEIIINVWLAIAFKCILLLLLKTFNVKSLNIT